MDEKTERYKRLVEAVAEALHEHEGEYFTWPEHDGDDGYRGDAGYVRLTPTDMRYRYQDLAKAAIRAYEKAKATEVGCTPYTGAMVFMGEQQCKDFGNV